MSNDLISQEIGLCDRPKCQETTLGDTYAQIWFKTASKQSHDLPLLEVNTSRSREDGRVETSTDKSLGEDASKQGRNDDKTEELNLTDGADTEVLVEDKGSGEKSGNTANQVCTAKAELKHKTFEELQKLYQKKQKWIDNFVLMDFKNEEKKSVEPKSKGKKGKRIKRVADSALKQKSSKKQKMMQEQESTKSDKKESTDYEQEKKELIMWLTVISDEEETVDLEILSTKYPIVDWESQILGNVDMEDLHVYKIIRANRNISYHKSLSSMLRKFDRQDLVDLHRLVMKRFEDNTSEGYNLMLWGDLKVIFEPNAEDEIWSNQQDWNLISWKLYENYEVHTLLIDGTLNCLNLLVEKRYPLIKKMLEKMLN
uniref:Uncharacterized protein n=1 Tax=Tanacetum cinerariifolium TaxID=118510 RepID=A0A6L2JAF5_TANCI|nr:hypothetical protein [Tanacetum cinerariifolium]